MTRVATYLVPAALAVGLLAASGPARAQIAPLIFLGSELASEAGLPSPVPAPGAVPPPPLFTGRSVAMGQPGNFCTTPVRTCQLYHTSWVGNGCSCHVPGGRAQGSVVP